MFFLSALRDCYNSRADLTVETVDWNSLVVFRASPEINCDSISAEERRKSDEVLASDLSYATYLAVPAVIVSIKAMTIISIFKL